MIKSSRTSCARAGAISGSGLEHANTIGFGAIVFSNSAGNKLGPERPSLPRPKIAVPSVITATRLPLAEYLYASSGFSAMALTHRDLTSTLKAVRVSDDASP